MLNRLITIVAYAGTLSLLTSLILTMFNLFPVSSRFIFDVSVTTIILVLIIKLWKHFSL